MRTLGSVRGASGNGRPYRDPSEHHTDKGWTVEIEVPETGERLEYPLDAILDDPEAR
ncbi:DUF5397 domain-containing protein (plasmid) [Acidithiobacillus ferrooxidans]|uniref:DUF5397 family protein n=1 Tax=Acidithiobacillus ferrooxidans TaxID=920 RepID=UPI0002187AB9|nr:DUF5397 family protein [Acidithiobacillus ferrooxidans]EGQ63025.1 hypothetical protein GGI1_16574 [Acidithiobacillus sp. GGI-221]MBU2775870.1 DUF5397 family protein [Acidithiobacillus ferrooxidans]QZT54340.1 DUF5397 domain-containing protein [Acidithiobacillus ferrooxidans]BDB15979.1 hypothetical protein ANFP_32990 [Acidithiobacillus ferrooxidans]